jgi:hypothetical protein
MFYFSRQNAFCGDIKELDPAICELRRLHDEMDAAVLSAYGWSDLSPKCEFFEEFAPEEDDEGANDAGKPIIRKYRYRWPDETRDEVLARLLLLNRKREAAESLVTDTALKRPAPRGPRSRSTKAFDTTPQGELAL